MARLSISIILALILSIASIAPAPCENDAAESAYIRGMVLYNTHRYPDALRCFELAFQLKPKTWLPYYNMGDCLVNLEQPGLAIQVLSAGIDKDSKHSSLWLTRANAYYCIGNLKCARSDIEHAISLNPKNAGYYSKRADFATVAHDWQKALKDYTTAIELCKSETPATPDARRCRADCCSQAYKDRGNANLTVGNYQAAVDDYTHALNSPVRTFHIDKVLHDRADCYDKLGKHDLAAKDRQLTEKNSHEVLDDLMK